MSAKGIIGTIYFSAARDDNNRPISKYEGVIKSFVVRRDDGSEFTVESEEKLPYSKVPLSKEALETLQKGETLQCVTDGRYYTVYRVFPDYGDVWVRDNETHQIRAKKHNDLRRSV